MKGFINHVISNINRIEREMARDRENIQAPYLLEEYRDWLSSQSSIAETTSRNYISSLKSLDELILSFRAEDEFDFKKEDFYTLLQKAFEQQKFDELPALLDDYDAEITEWIEWSKAENDAYFRPRHFSDMRSAFRNYRVFIEETVGKIKKDKQQLPPQTTKNLFLQNEFIDWLQTVKDHTPESAASAVSRIKSLNKQFLCTLIPDKCIDILALLPGFIKQSPEKVYLLLDKLTTHVNNAANHPENTSIHPATLRFMRRAFYLYTLFLKEKISDFIDEEQAVCEEDSDKTTLISNLPTASHEYDEIEDNFRFRLLSHDRMSNSKPVFYPIRLIRRIFTQNSKLARLGLIDNKENYLKWLYRWADNCAAKTKVITDKGEFILADIDLLEIDSQAQRVMVLLPNGEKAQLMTKTDKGDVVPMKAGILEEITIDHITPMANILEENANQLPALSKLSEMMRQEAQKKGIPITLTNLTKINNEVLNNVEFKELASLIPQLKEDLTVIGNASTLQLMNRTYNLRKK